VSETLTSLLGRHRIVVCAGPGGVGKTTTAAALAIQAARQGLRACVVTIDPARRLADALGLGALGNDPTPVEGAWAGELWAVMLDTKSTFDSLVTRYAANPAQAETILANRLYRNISGALSGTQEYMAMEKLYELNEGGRFDLIVVDTPPTRHALDFLDSPRRLTRFLDNRIFRLLMMPTRAGLRAANVATQLLLRTISKVVGGEVVADTVAFFTAFEGMEEGFRIRAQRVYQLLTTGVTGFVLVCSPRPEAVEEGCYFAAKLAESGLEVAALVVNRVYPTYGLGAKTIEALAGRVGDDASAQALLTNVRQLADLAAGEEVALAELTERLATTALARVPDLPVEVSDLESLGAVADYLVIGPSSGSA
jgi:anion-transporting  ArsA/GET3 family ATPase